MKPVTYWIDTEEIQNLCARYGCFLEKLNRKEKASIRTFLSFWISMRFKAVTASIENAYASVEAGWLSAEISDYSLATEDVEAAILMIENLENEQIESLLTAIQSLINTHET